MTKPNDESNQTIQTTGGAYVQGNVKANRDFIGRDQIQHHPIEAQIGDIGASAQVAIGNNNSVQIITRQAATKQAEQVALAEQIMALKRQIALLPLSDEQKVISNHYLAQIRRMFLEEVEAVDEELLRVAARWLLGNVPQLTDTLTQLLQRTSEERPHIPQGEISDVD